MQRMALIRRRTDAGGSTRFGQFLLQASAVLCVLIGDACGAKSPLSAGSGSAATGPGGATSGGAGAGSEASNGAHADAFVDAIVGGGDCRLARMPFVTLGQAASNSCSMVTTLRDGDSQNGTAVHVSCSVAMNGNGYDMSLTASVAGSSGGTFALSGRVSPSDAGFVQQSALMSTFASARYGTYKPLNLDEGCTVTAYLQYTTGGCPSPTSTPVSPGRIWGHVSCPQLQVENVQSPVNACNGEADFFFENCEP